MYEELDEDDTWSIPTEDPTELIRNNDSIGLRKYIFETFPWGTYMDIVYFGLTSDETYHQLYNVLIDAVIEHNKPDCLRVILANFPLIQYNTIAKNLLATGNMTLYNIVKDFVSEFDIGVDYMCISPHDRVKALDNLLESSENASSLCVVEYENLTLGVVEYLEDIHAVLIKHANPDDHIILEERLLALLVSNRYVQAKKMICKFIKSHPEYKWCDKDGNTFVHYLVTSFSKDQIKNILEL
jgi:hypothetical protein